jgi:hypothetical protein
MSTTDLLTSRTHRSGRPLVLSVAFTLRGLVGCTQMREFPRHH